MMKLNKRWTAHCNLVLGATGMILMTIAGCGGGGGGGSRRVAVSTPAPTNIPSAEPQPTPTATPVPTPLPTPVPQPDGSCPLNPDIYRPNYAAELLAGYNDPQNPNAPAQPPGELLRHARFPLRVYFNVNADLTDARRAYAIQGFNQWVAGTNNRVKYTVTTNKTVADVVVTFSPFDASDQNVLGIATLAWDPTTNILFEFFQDNRPNVADENKAGHLLLNYTGDLRTDTTTAAHEFGHILGIGGHSPSNLDQMYFANNPNSSGNVTPSDLNTLRTSYCDNFPQLSAGLSAGLAANRRTTNGPIRTLVIKDTFEEITHHLK